ncbi:MAG: DUF559 domain-containing protein [Archangium sp.]
MGEGEITCLQLASTQHGVISKKQATTGGLTERCVEHRCTTGRWDRLFPGVFRIEGTPPTFLQKLKALSLWLDAGFALSHETAAHLHGFARFDEGSIEAVCIRNVRKRRGVIVHRVQALSHKDISSVEGLRVTTVTRTILDLCSRLSEHDLRAMVDEALRRKWTTLDKLESALKKRTAHEPFASLARLVHEYQGGDGPTESELEARAFELIDLAGLPRPKKQRVVKVNGRVRRIDFFFEQFGVVLEVDGFAVHASPKSFEDDRRRNNALVLRGYAVLHWTWRSIHDEPEQILLELTHCLSRRQK